MNHRIHDHRWIVITYPWWASGATARTWILLRIWLPSRCIFWTQQLCFRKVGCRLASIWLEGCSFSSIRCSYHTSHCIIIKTTDMEAPCFENLSEHVPFAAFLIELSSKQSCCTLSSMTFSKLLLAPICNFSKNFTACSLDTRASQKFVAVHMSPLSEFQVNIT